MRACSCLKSDATLSVCVPPFPTTHHGQEDALNVSSTRGYRLDSSVQRPHFRRQIDADYTHFLTKRTKSSKSDRDRIWSLDFKPIQDEVRQTANAARSYP